MKKKEQLPEGLKDLLLTDEERKRNRGAAMLTRAFYGAIITSLVAYGSYRAITELHTLKTVSATSESAIMNKYETVFSVQERASLTELFTLAGWEEMSVEDLFEIMVYRLSEMNLPNDKKTFLLQALTKLQIAMHVSEPDQFFMLQVKNIVNKFLHAHFVEGPATSVVVASMLLKQSVSVYEGEKSPNSHRFQQQLAGVVHSKNTEYIRSYEVKDPKSTVFVLLYDTGLLFADKIVDGMHYNGSVDTTARLIQQVPVSFIERIDITDEFPFYLDSIPRGINMPIESNKKIRTSHMTWGCGNVGEVGRRNNRAVKTGYSDDITVHNPNSSLYNIMRGRGMSTVLKEKQDKEPIQILFMEKSKEIYEEHLKNGDAFLPLGLPLAYYTQSNVVILDTKSGKILVR